MTVQSQSKQGSLSPAQRDMLERIAASRYGSHCIYPKGRRTADVLVRYGLLKNIGQGWCEITLLGRQKLTASEEEGHA